MKFRGAIVVFAETMTNRMQAFSRSDIELNWIPPFSLHAGIRFTIGVCTAARPV